jgi:hypothetical protein
LSRRSNQEGRVNNPGLFLRGSHTLAKQVRETSNRSAGHKVFLLLFLQKKKPLLFLKKKKQKDF